MTRKSSRTRRESPMEAARPEARERIDAENMPHDKRPWEPMTLTRVGNLGTVIQSMMGSGADGGTTAAMMTSS